MAIQAPLYSENPGCLGPVSDQDYLFMDNNNNVCGFSFVPQPPQKKQKQQEFVMQFDQFQNFSHESFWNRPLMPMPPASSSYTTQIEKIDIDRFISLQNERLRLALLQQRKHQISQFLNKYQPKIQFLLKQKDEQIAKATKRTLELENYLKKLENENEAWQRLAKDNEATIASLKDTIERLRESTGLSNNDVDDAASCCGEEEEEEESRRKMLCKWCKMRNSCVVILPCRHLCCCKYCEAFLDCCPVCRTVKKASIEIEASLI